MEEEEISSLACALRYASNTLLNSIDGGMSSVRKNIDNEQEKNSQKENIVLSISSNCEKTTSSLDEESTTRKIADGMLLRYIEELSGSIDKDLIKKITALSSNIKTLIDDTFVKDYDRINSNLTFMTEECLKKQDKLIAGTGIAITSESDKTTIFASEDMDKLINPPYISSEVTVDGYPDLTNIPDISGWSAGTPDYVCSYSITSVNTDPGYADPNYGRMQNTVRELSSNYGFLWCRKYRSGWMEQGGTITWTGSYGGTYSIKATYPVAFTKYVAGVSVLNNPLRIRPILNKVYSNSSRDNPKQNVKVHGNISGMSHTSYIDNLAGYYYNWGACDNTQKTYTWTDSYDKDDNGKFITKNGLTGFLVGYCYHLVGCSVYVPPATVMWSAWGV